MNPRTLRHLPAAFFLLLGSAELISEAKADPAPAADVVYVTGQVHQQGPIEIPPGQTLTVHKVIILDGGLGDFADRLHIKLMRTNPDGTSTTIMVNLATITDRNHLEKDPIVKPGDVIVVPMLPIDYTSPK